MGGPRAGCRTARAGWRPADTDSSSGASPARNTGGPPSSTLSLRSSALPYQRLNVRAHRRGAAGQAVVLGDAALGERPARPHRTEHECAHRLLLARVGGLEHLARDHALGQVVQALEALRARRSTGRRGPRASRARASPASSSTCPAALALEVPRPERPALTDLREHVLDHLGMLAQRTLVAAPVTRGRRIRQRNSGKSSTGTGTPRAPSTRTPGPRSAAGRPSPRDRRRPSTRARCGGCARRSRSSRAARTRAAGWPPPRRPRAPAAGAAAKPWWDTTWRRRAAREIVGKWTLTTSKLEGWTQASRPSTRP